MFHYYFVSVKIWEDLFSVAFVSFVEENHIFTLDYTQNGMKMLLF